MTPATGTRRFVDHRVLVAIALGIGIAIAFVDAAPGWDSTGITAFALLGSSAAVAALAGDRPWLWALLIGLPLPVVEGLGTGDGSLILTLAFPFAGAAIGWLVARARGS